MKSLFLLLAALSQLDFTKPVIVTSTELFRAPIVAPRVNIRGEGFNGTDPTGPVLLFDVGTDNGICVGVVTQKKDEFRCTGGSVERVRIVCRGQGGAAFYAACHSSAARPGELKFRDVKIMGLSDVQGGPTKDNWEIGAAFIGTKGIDLRSVDMELVRIAGCRGDSLVAKYVTHFTARNIEVDTGKSGRIPTVVFENCRQVNFSGRVFGEIHLRGCEVVEVTGYAQAVYIDKACKMVTLRGIFPKVVSEGNPVLKNQSAFTRW